MMACMHNATAVALALFHLALALGVSLHVLLHRRETTSSIAWIALAWLAPLTGGLLYLLLGINRVRRRATTLRGSVADQLATAALSPGERADHLNQLERAGQRITARTVRSGNAIAILHNGDEAYPEMLAAIESAKQSVGMSTYLFRADSVGLSFIEALIRAKARGVSVRVLIDGIGGGYFLSSSYRRLRFR